MQFSHDSIRLADRRRYSLAAPLRRSFFGARPPKIQHCHKRHPPKYPHYRTIFHPQIPPGDPKSITSGLFPTFALTFSTRKSLVVHGEMNGFPFSEVGMCNLEKYSGLLLLYKHISTCPQCFPHFLFYTKTYTCLFGCRPQHF